MTALVVDSSIVIKWLVPEPDTPAALSLRGRYEFLAPDLLMLECANIFWKKVRRRELTAEEALVSAEAIEQAGIEFVSMNSRAAIVTRLALELDHPAYDCAYVALALEARCRLVTADRRLIETVQRGDRRDIGDLVVSLADLP